MADFCPNSLFWNSKEYFKHIVAFEKDSGKSGRGSRNDKEMLDIGTFSCYPFPQGKFQFTSVVYVEVHTTV